MNRLDKSSLDLSSGGTRLTPISSEKNAVGFCPRCDGILESLAYHKNNDEWLVSARCSEGHTCLLKYDSSWRWKGDEDLDVSSESESPPKGLSEIPREQLDAVFSPGEIRAMEACEEGEAYTRQNLYRARAKYDKFERLFGIKIEI